MVRLMLSHGITFRPATDLLNQVYVEAATAELEGAGKKPTDSRLTIMTGIHRKDIKRLQRDYGVNTSQQIIVDSEGNWLSLVEAARKLNELKAACDRADEVIAGLQEELAREVARHQKTEWRTQHWRARRAARETKE